MEIRELTIKNCEEVISLWESTAGAGLDKDVDTKERIWIYLHRNPGLSFAAFEKGKFTLEDLRDLAIKLGEPKQISGKQELYEAIINQMI